MIEAAWQSFQNDFFDAYKPSSGDPGKDETSFRSSEEHSSP